METPTITNLPDGGRIGVLGDTHCERDGRRLPAVVFDAFADVQLIIHLGDCGDPGTLDELGRLAPVLATRGGDDAADDPRYTETRVVTAAGLVVGALFDLAHAGLTVADGRFSPPPAGSAAARLALSFGRPVDVVLFAATHAPLVAYHGGILFLNPGSATLPAPPRASTIGLLDVRGSGASVEIINL